MHTQPISRKPSNCASFILSVSGTYPGLNSTGLFRARLPSDALDDPIGATARAEAADAAAATAASAALALRC